MRRNRKTTGEPANPMLSAVKKSARDRLRRRLATVMAGVVVFTTTYSLILPALTLEKDKAADMPGFDLVSAQELDCEFEVHHHTDSCYKTIDGKRTLVCGKVDYVVHVHDENCYDADGNLVCTLPEIKEHKHTDSCYKTEKELTCTLEEAEGHTHTDACYEEKQGGLICGHEEHVHTDACYSDVVVGTEATLVCGYEAGQEISPAVYSDPVYSEPVYSDPVYDSETGELIQESQMIKDCEMIQGPQLLQEAVLHYHDESCYQTYEVTERQLTCGLEEHTHTPECYETVRELVCGQEEAEGHKHSDSCYTTKKVLTCGDIELHTHTEACYEKGPNGESPFTMGWLKKNEEGELVGDPSHLICGKLELKEHKHTAECFKEVEIAVPVETEAETTAEETEELTDTLSGDKTEETEEALAEEETDATEKLTEEETEALEDLYEEIETETEELEDLFGDTEEEETEDLPGETYRGVYYGRDFIVHVDAGPEAGLPEDAILVVSEILQGTADYQEYAAQAGAGLNEEGSEGEEPADEATKEVTFARFFDISFVVDGEKVEPNDFVKVEITFHEAQEVNENQELTVVHFTDEGTETLDHDPLVSEQGLEKVTFDSDTFSVFGIVGTETISTQFITADGKTLSVTATFDARELLPKDAVLEVSEVTYEDDPDAYAKRNERLAEALFEKYGNVAITDARYLDISVMVPDESVGGDAKKEYEPVYPVKVKVDYTETMDTTNPGEYKDYNDGSTKVTPDIGNHIVGVHYTEEGAEFLETVDENTNTGVSETVTKTDSFSEYDFAYIYEYEVIDTNYDYEPSQISTMTLNTGMTTKAAGSGMLRAAGDTPAHTKTLSNNHDGTHKLSLTVTGDADTDSNTASNANVIIVFDTSNSMINYYVPMTNGARGSNNADGSNSFVLYRNTSGTEADDGYSGTVYYRYRDGNRYRYSEYTGQRYSKTIRRADAAEKVLYDFAHALYGYQNTDDPSTPQDESQNIQTALITFNRSASTVQNWTSTESDITSRVSSTGNGGSKKLGNSSGTNWEDALRQAQTVMESADDDPTFVVFITDGQPTQWHGSPSGEYDTTGQGYIEARDEARAVQLACAATGTDSHGTLFGIYAYGTEADYLDELMYYAYSGTARDMDPGTVATDGYYNAADSSSLADAINDIFSKIVKTLGITGVSVNDGTTSQVQTTSGEISHLLEVDTSTYEYWLSFNTVDGKFTMKDLLSGNDIEYTVTSSGNNVTISWSKDGNNYSETYEGTYSAGIARIKWDRATSFYNYAPPTASFTNPSVDWDLSTVGTLLDGVTYEVTFDVYPSQYTLDLIAQMKNGEIKYSDLDSEVKKYLKEDYTLHTNTEANLTYTDSRNDQGEQTVPYVNPEPVSTNSEQLTINKEWVGGDPDTDSLPITVMMGGEEFHTSTLSAANNWSTDANISIGIIKNGQALSGAIGHDFSFAELDDTQYHWELDAPTVRPMLVNGTLTMLIKVDAKHPAPSGAVTYTIDGSTYYVDSSTTGLTATNIRRSYLDVIKTVTGANAPADAVFDFTMKVVNSRASTAGDPENLDSDYYVWFSVADSNNGYTLVIDDNLVNGNVTRATNDSGAYTGYYYMPSGTEIHVNMKAGYSLRFLNLPSGSSYEVAESATMPNESFSFVSITGDGTVDPDNNQKMTGTIVTANNGYRVSVQNKYTAVDVQLKKVDDKDQLLSGAIFTLAKQQGTAWGNIQEDIKPGDTESGTANPVDLGGLGVGKYRLTETKSPDGYIKLTSHIDFEVYKDGTALAVKLAEGTTGAKIEKSGTEDAPVYTVIVENTPGEALPMTGGSGTLPYTLGGIALIMASALMYGFGMRRRERRLN